MRLEKSPRSENRKEKKRERVDEEENNKVGE